MKNNAPLTQAEIDERYEKSLIAFLHAFEAQLDIQNKKTGSKHAFIMLMIRDPSVSNVDIASNLTTKSLIPILESALKTAKDEFLESENEITHCLFHAANTIIDDWLVHEVVVEKRIMRLLLKMSLNASDPYLSSEQQNQIRLMMQIINDDS